MSSLPVVLREPLVHFLILAAALFVVGGVVGGGGDVIEITQEQIEWRILQAEAQEGRTLTPEERVLIRERYIDERVLAQRARELDLTEDERIDDILVQKMLHVLSGDVIQPTDEELEAFYEMNLDWYATEPTVSVDEIVVPVGSPLPDALLEGTDPADLPDGTLIADRVMSELDFEDLSQVFGDEATRTIFDAETGAWVDAYQSVRGQHWFRVRERTSGGQQGFETVRDLVRLDWIAEQEDRRLLARVAELREEYSIEVEGAP